MRVVTIWWWTWTFNMLSALKNIPGVDIAAIIAMSDDGGRSTSKLRDEYWVLPPWDLRRWVVALSNSNSVWLLRELFNYRFSWWTFDGHNLWNLFLMALEAITWDYGKAIDAFETIFWLSGKIYPSTYEKIRLLAQLETNQFVVGEANIDEPKHDGNINIKDFYVIKEKYHNMLKTLSDEGIALPESVISPILDIVVQDRPAANPEIKDVLLQADYIILWPWDLYSSVLPNIVIWDVAKIIKESKAQKILFVNLFNKFWETTNFKLSNFLDIYIKYLWADIFDYIVCHDERYFPVQKDILEKYKLENKDLIEVDLQDNRIHFFDLVKQVDMARHDPQKITYALKQIFKLY